MAHVSLAGLVPVAGRSSRMGSFKPLMRLGEQTVIEATVDTMLGMGVEHVVVVTGHRGVEVEAVLSRRFGNRVSFVRNNRFAETDMMESIRVGCKALPQCDAFFLLPGDMPAVNPETLRRLQDAWEQRGGVVFPAFGGKRKHPPLIASDLIEDIVAFRGNGGLREFWKTCGGIASDVATDDRGTQIDLDYPHDYVWCKELLGLVMGAA